jgi:hypothetical protein
MDAVVLVLMGVSAWIAFDLAAWYWGCDSSEPFDSPEWERRRTWRW